MQTGNRDNSTSEEAGPPTIERAGAGLRTEWMRDKSESRDGRSATSKEELFGSRASMDVPRLHSHPISPAQVGSSWSLLES